MISDQKRLSQSIRSLWSQGEITSRQCSFANVTGRTDLVQHHIETVPWVGVRSQPYRLPEGKKKVVQEELKGMLGLGVIEESYSDWASPIVLVPKCFCVDYRKVNAVSKCDAHPMLRVDKLLDR